MNKRLLSLVLCTVMLSGSAAGCHNAPNDDVVTSQSTATLTSETAPETEKELSAEESVTASDLLSAAETRRAEFMERRCEPQFTDGGKIYYISPDGCDDNDGLSPEFYAEEVIVDLIHTSGTALAYLFRGGLGMGLV